MVSTDGLGTADGGWHAMTGPAEPGRLGPAAGGDAPPRAPGSTGSPLIGEGAAGPDPHDAALRAARIRMAMVVVLTGAVVAFAALIAVWMYWLGGQLPAASMPVS